MDVCLIFINVASDSASYFDWNDWIDEFVCEISILNPRCMIPKKIPMKDDICSYARNSKPSVRRDPEHVRNDRHVQPPRALGR